VLPRRKVSITIMRPPQQRVGRQRSAKPSPTSISRFPRRPGCGFFFREMSNFAQTPPSHGHLLAVSALAFAVAALVINRSGSLRKPTMKPARFRPAGAPLRLKECNMDTQTLLIIIIIVLLIGGGGWYGRGRWY
jgi:hypothetical protein